MYTFIEVGYFKKAFGTQGEVRLDIKDRFLEDVLSAKALFADQRGTYVPYFVEHIQDKGSFIVKVEEIDTPEAAIEISSKVCYLREQDIAPSHLRMMDGEMDFLIGYTLYNQNHPLGPVLRIEEYPQQLMLVVKHLEKEILIPLTDEWIQEINKKEAYIDMELPENFLDVFL